MENGEHLPARHEGTAPGSGDAHPHAPSADVLAWLLDTDPAIRWGPEFGDSPFFEGEVEPCIDLRHRDTLYEGLAGAVGAPNRWITLRALGVLRWYGGTEGRQERASEA